MNHEFNKLHRVNAGVQLAYDFLEEVHDGWENEDGAYGEFVFDVGERTIRLEYNERVMTTSYSEHEF